MERWIFLSGMMGSGKSIVGRALAARLGAAFVDLDARIVERAGVPVRAIFTERGERAFRTMEAEEIARILDLERPSVVALGGGTITTHATRRRLLREGILITLSASAAELARRLEGAEDRPLLFGGEPADVLARIADERSELYAECHARLDTEGRPLEEIVDAILAIADAPPIPVALGLRTYCVHVGAGLLRTLPAYASASALVLVTDTNVNEPWGKRVSERLSPVATVVLAPGEEHKHLASIDAIWTRALEAGIDRNALLVALGGGVVGDLAAFAASTLLRGIALLAVPTSLLAMVDASVGGKTGFDRPQGKNLIGTFHQPRAVLCDIDVLSTLPDAELRSGLAEVVKSAWLAGESEVSMLEADAEALLARDRAALERAVRMSVRFKAEVVAEDERESERRMVLNLGHTIGHAIEAAHDYRMRHGEAVALGMIAAFRVAAALGDPEASERGVRMAHLLERLDLPTDVDRHLDERTLRFVGADKKRAAGNVRFIVPHAPGHIEIVPIPITELARAVRAGDGAD